MNTYTHARNHIPINTHVDEIYGDMIDLEIDVVTTNILPENNMSSTVCSERIVPIKFYK